jgi:hypothetical protein
MDSEGEEDDFSEEEEGDWTRLMRRSADIIQEFDKLLAQLASLETSVGDIEVYFSGLFKKGNLANELNLLEQFYQAGLALKTHPKNPHLKKPTKMFFLGFCKL